MTNTNKNKLNNLEKEIIKYFLRMNDINEDFYGEDFELLRVTNRRMTGVGFYTDLETDKAFKEKSLELLRWTKIGALLKDNLEVGFLIFVDEYKINCIEGFTYGGAAWPDKITSFKMRELEDNEF